MLKEMELTGSELPEVHTAIPGPRSPEEARANALAARQPIPDAFWSELRPLVRSWDIVAPRGG